jgi:hypothetical protein
LKSGSLNLLEPSGLVMGLLYLYLLSNNSSIMKMNKVTSYNFYREYYSDNLGLSNVSKEVNAFMSKVL